MSEEQQPRQSGEFVIRNHAMPPVKMDASDWPRSEGPRTAGDFVVKNHALPPMELSMPAAESVFLELSFEVTKNVPPETARKWLEFLIERLDCLEKALGGTGIACQKNGLESREKTTTIALRANESLGAKERFKQIIQNINKSMMQHIDSKCSLAKVYHITFGGQREDDFEVKPSSAP